MKIENIAVSKISFNDDYVRFQAMEKSNKDAFNRGLHELAVNIKAIGLLNPITVIPDGKKYIVVAGNRRLAACMILQMKEVPCHIQSSTDNVFEIAFSENINREDLTDIEKGEWINKAVEYYTTQPEFKKSKKPVEAIMLMLATKLGKKVRTLYDWRKLAAVSTAEEKADVKAGRKKASKIGKAKQKARVAKGEAKTRKKNPLQQSGKFFVNTEKKFLAECSKISDTLGIIAKHHKEFHQRKRVIAAFQKLQKVVAITNRYFAGVK